MKAKHFKVKYEGSYSGKPYIYEETVPVSEYQLKDRFWLSLMPSSKREAIEQLNNAEDGDFFEWSYEDGRMEIRAIG